MKQSSSSSSSSSSSRAIYEHDEMNTTPSPSNDDTNTLLVRCDRVGLSSIDLYKLRTFVGVLQDEEYVVDSDTLFVREDPSVPKDLAPPDPHPNVDSACTLGSTRRVLAGLSVASSEGLDYSLYCRVVAKRRLFLQSQSRSVSSR